MHTFNLAFVFGEIDEVIMVVCASEEPIDRELVNLVATEYFEQVLPTSKTPEHAIRQVVNDIKEEFGFNVVTVTADVACHVFRA